MNPNSKLVCFMLFIYSMETFLYSAINKAQTSEDVNKIDSLGPFVKILDLILYKANTYREDR